MININYYFASKKNFDGETLIPRIPTNKMKCEDDIIQRICVSQSINGCLTAVGGFNIGDIIYIHNCKSNSAIQPHLKQVNDVCFTGEQWILEPVEMKLFMTVVIIGMIDATVNNMSNIMYSFKLVEN